MLTKSKIAFNAPTESHRVHPVACRHPYEPDSKYQCGVFEVPLNYHNPFAGNGQIYYARLPADEGVRKGTIFVDPGFPSATVLELTPPVWLLVWGSVLHNRTGGEYDVVVWNARGKGAPSHSLTTPGPVTCFANTFERDQFYAGAAAELGFAAQWDHNLEYQHLQNDKHQEKPPPQIWANLDMWAP
ncbi:hypothetical protein LXA43DRAFT_1100743 [Ganoderma leucocontextum]|nr:hypothetical protein LXA43DRAFT_1100743 [Ganoderma leucocontextum]